MNKPCADVRLYTLAGIYTAPNFLDSFRDKLAEMLRCSGFHVRASSLFPYGDWSRSKSRQAAEIACDLVLPAVGGRRVLKDLSCSGDDVVLLIGHSGGGVAAVRAASKLVRQGQRVAAIAMIGSPKIPIPRDLANRTAFMYACNDAGAITDPVTRLGAWRGRQPKHKAALRLIGGHPDYFRMMEPFRNEEGRSNLEVTVEALVPWLLDRLSS